jgi:hypothetical protein
MSIEQIVKEATALPQEQRKELIGRLLAIGRSQREEAELKRMDALIDDNDPSHWITYDELKRRLPADAVGE